MGFRRQGHATYVPRMQLSTCGRRHCEGAGRGSPGLWIHCLIEKALGIENMGWEGSEEELAGGTFSQSAEVFGESLVLSICLPLLCSLCSILQWAPHCRIVTNRS